MYKNIVFVFGSNLAGRHGKGAALHARKEWGAVNGRGVGRHGNSYAIPTKDEKLIPLDLYWIQQHINNFLLHCIANADELFIFTPVGTGLAGYTVAQIKGLIMNRYIPPNVMFTKDWLLPKE